MRLTAVPSRQLDRVQDGLAASCDDDTDPEQGTAADLLGAKLISARAIARALNRPCPRCRRAERAGKPVLTCSSISCDRWSTRRARRWFRRSQCLPSQPCAARQGGRCACQIGFQLSPNGQWITTWGRLRERAPDISDAMLSMGDDDD